MQGKNVKNQNYWTSYARKFVPILANIAPTGTKKAHKKNKKPGAQMVLFTSYIEKFLNVELTDQLAIPLIIIINRIPIMNTAIPTFCFFILYLLFYCNQLLYKQNCFYPHFMLFNIYTYNGIGEQREKF